MRRLLMLCLNIVFIEWTESQNNAVRLRGPRLRGPRLFSQSTIDQSAVPALSHGTFGQMQLDTPSGVGMHIQTGSNAGLPIGFMDNSIFNGIYVHTGGATTDSNFQQTGHFDLNSQSVMNPVLSNLPVTADTVISAQQSLGNAHVDWPGEHGNRGNRPVLHQQAPVTLGGATIVDISRPVGTVTDINMPTSHANMVPGSATHGPLVDIPTGAHVDMPREHGNTENVPALHVPDNTVVAPTAHVDLPGEHNNMAAVPMIHSTGGLGAGQSMSAAETKFTQADAVFGAVNHVNQGRVPVVQIAGIADAPVGMGIPPGRPGPPFDIIPGTHVDLPGEHGNTRDVPVLHVPDTPPNHGGMAGFPAGQTSIAPGPDAHVDFAGEHGNTASVPVVHIPDQTATQTGSGQPDTLVDFAAGTPGQSVTGTPTGPITHVDFPGEHGNTAAVPVPHIPDQTPAHQGASGLPPAQQASSVEFSASTHVDLPWEHGNRDSVPVLHIPDHAVAGTHTGTPGVTTGQPITVNGSPATPLYLPGEHGNMPPVSAVPIPDNIFTQLGTPGFASDRPITGSQLPGNSDFLQIQTQDGVLNIPDIPSDFPFFDTPYVPSQATGTAIGTHVDLPGEHGNTGAVPSLHIPDPGMTNPGVPSFIPGQPAIPVNTGPATHIDFLGQHGNPSSVPVVPISEPGTTHMGSFGLFPGQPATPVNIGPNTNVEFPGQHGNQAHEPVVYIPDSGNTHGGPSRFFPSHPPTPVNTSPITHVDLPGEHGNQARVPVVHVPNTNPNVIPALVPSFTNVVVGRPPMFGSQTPPFSGRVIPDMAVNWSGVGLTGGVGGYPRTRGRRLGVWRQGRRTPGVVRPIDRFINVVPGLGSPLIPRRPVTGFRPLSLSTPAHDLGSRFGLETVDLNGSARPDPAGLGRPGSYTGSVGKGGRATGGQITARTGRRGGRGSLPLLESVFRTVRRVMSPNPARSMRVAQSERGLLGSLTRLVGGRV